MTIKMITYREAKDFLLPRHYSGRTPSISVAFGWFAEQGDLKAVCTFGKPASSTLCTGVCGKEWSNDVFELNRLCRVEDLDCPLSKFVSGCLRILSRLNIIVVSYSDSAMNHHGYIYQACNFLYTGMTKPRTDQYAPDGKHHRHAKVEDQLGFRKVRSAKYRYVYFCTRSKTLRKKWTECLNYELEPYPKGDNKNYVLGEYIQDRVVKDRRYD